MAFNEHLRAGESMHFPKYYLPGGSWEFSNFDTVSLSMANGKRRSIRPLCAEAQSANCFCTGTNVSVNAQPILLFNMSRLFVELAEDSESGLEPPKLHPQHDYETLEY